MHKVVFGLIVMVIFFSCSEKVKQLTLKKGTYRVSMLIGDEQEIPFLMEFDSKDSLRILNAEEIINITEVEYKNDSMFISIPAFEGVLKSRIHTDTSFTGIYFEPNMNRKVPFKAVLGSNRFSNPQIASFDITGNWEAVFSPDVEEDKYIAKGIFEQKDGIVEGTFRTTTGDYRFLEGVLSGDELRLSTFDGSHAFLFEATVTDSTMKGMFYSGNHWKEPFTAKRNESYELPNADSLTYLKEGYDKLEFSFKNSEGNLVSLSDDRFKNKVVVVQLMGSWCPNCLDESRFFVQYYENNKDQPIEFVALAFEYAKTESLAFKALKRLKERVGITYPIVLAQYGSSSKSKAQEKLPMLNHVWSYPTSIFIDKNGQVRKIHTGFNGPATGDKYIQFKNDFNSFMKALIEEE